MRKFSGVYLSFTLQICFIGIFVLVLLGYHLQVTEKSFLENRMYSENVSGIQLSDYQHPENVDCTVPNVNDKFILYRYLSESASETVRGIYASADVFGLSEHISQGRFFAPNDYTDKTSTAVIGPEILPMTVEKNGVRYYPYNQQMYEVIGVFSETDTALDTAVYLNLTCVLEDENNIGLYYVDAENETTVNAVLSAIKADAAGKYRTIDVEYESVVSYGLGAMFNTLLIFAVASAVFCLLITTIFFVTHQKYTVSVQKLCGMTKKRVAFVYGIKNLSVTVLATLLMTGAMLFLTHHSDNSIFSIETLTTQHYVITGISLLALSAVITFFTVRLAEGINISDTLKGR